jgi:DNA-directed RNA polymerase specialized sigma24 family protein
MSYSSAMDQAARRHLHDAMLRLKDGDRDAARPVFDALWGPTLALARASLGDDADAHDAAQQAMMKVFAGVASFDPERSALGWALALVTWEVRTVRTRRRRRREDAAVDIDGVSGVGAGPDVDLVHAEDVARVADAFVRLDARDQETLRAFLDGAAAGAPRERKRRQRAIDRLRALVLGPAAAPLSGDDHV